jgi:hypothetical protein
VNRIHLQGIPAIVSWDALNVIEDEGSYGCNRKAKESVFKKSRNRVYLKIYRFFCEISERLEKT